MRPSQIQNPVGKEGKSKKAKETNEAKQSDQFIGESAFGTQDSAVAAPSYSAPEPLLRRNAGGNDNNAPAPLVARAEVPEKETRIAVGYDKIAIARSPDDVLVTSGLENCIAVVIQDATTKVAIMGHFHTSNAMIDDQFSGQVLNALKTLLLTKLRRVVGPEIQPTFQIALGILWLHDGERLHDKKRNENRMSLIDACLQVFETEPVVGGSTAEFTVADSTLRGNGFRSEASESPIKPTSDLMKPKNNLDIPYDRLKKSDPAGHAVDEDLAFIHPLSLWRD